MDDAVLVGVLERGGDATDDVQRPFLVDGPFPPDQVTDGPAIDELHGEVVVLACPAHVNALHDVGVAELRGRTGLAEEPLDVGPVLGELRREDLQRDDAVHADLPRLEDRAHAARAKAAEDLVPAYPRLLC